MDRKAVLAMSDSSTAADYGDILRIPFDGGPTVETEAKGSFLAFDEIEPGKYAYISREVRTFSDGNRKLLGESIVEVSPGAKPKEIWSLFDHVQPDLSKTYPKNQYPGDSDVEDWSYIPHPCHHIIYLGQALRLWNGNTLVVWSTAGRLEELTPAKELAWSVHTALGTGIGFVHRVKSLY
jgi:hypothetical protein